MSVPTITLTGAALFGLMPSQAQSTTSVHAQMTVRLGRKPPRSDKSVLHLGNYLLPHTGMGPVIPDHVDWATRAMPAIARMYGNDAYGDCVMAACYHNIGAATANETGTAAVVTDAQVLDRYRAICGPNDDGCVITDVLDHWMNTGLPVGQQLDALDGYVAVDWTRMDLVRYAVYRLGAVRLGINLPAAWQSSAVWDVTPTPIVGGHDVAVIDFTPQGVRVASWGRLYLLTWAALTAHAWVEEAYVLLLKDWHARNGVSPSNLNVTQLQADLQAIKEGRLPDGPPDPAPPPQPPVLWSFSPSHDYSQGQKLTLVAGTTVKRGRRYAVIELPAHAQMANEHAVAEEEPG